MTKLNKSNNTEPKLAIILSYHEGKDYINHQLQSIFDQSFSNLCVFIGVDGSDSLLSIADLKINNEYLHKLTINFQPKNIGFAKNFMEVLASCPEDYTHFAFSDQDDVWEPDKIKIAIETLSQFPITCPALYCARTEIVDSTAKKSLGYSPLFKRPPSFANAIVQSIGGGNTMVFNKTARDLIVKSSMKTDMVSHDWWCYQIVSGAGGEIIYDPKPCLKYRQHHNNLIGANTSWTARLLRCHALLMGRFRFWNDTNLKALEKNRYLLTEPSIKCLNHFLEARQSNLIKRVFLFKRSGIYRQTFLGNLGLVAAILLNKV